MTTDRAGHQWPALTRRRVALLLALGLAAAPAGCGEELPSGFSRKAVDVAAVPEVVMKAARKAVPGVTFKEGWSNHEKGGALHSYEIRGRTANGKIREVRVSPAGTILEVE